MTDSSADFFNICWSSALSKSSRDNAVNGSKALETLVIGPAQLFFSSVISLQSSLEAEFMQRYSQSNNKKTPNDKGKQSVKEEKHNNIKPHK